MTAPRFLVPEVLAVGQTIPLPPACSHHARRVLRLRAQDRLVLFDGRGNEFEAFLVPDPLGGARCFATITRGAAVDREARLRITIVQALSAQEKMDWLVEKAVELGARRIILAAAARSVVRLSAARRERRADRWQDIAAAACSQCGRNELPRIEIADDLGAALRAAQDSSARWVLDPSARSGLGRASGDSITCAVGPEGGFTAEELALAHALGYAGANLGRRTLRTETAALAAICALLALHGEFS
ncbi:Ribosomal RNA small subunit methyltransferase E [Burkholderiales bacterium]|nr:Ribosomal RNA small subunit methyltransferase E [Burkholderiales bacterium]